MTDDFVRSQLRLPGDLHERIVEAASQSGRSMNAEIVHRLAGSFLTVAEAMEAFPSVKKLYLLGLAYQVSEAIAPMQHIVDNGKSPPETIALIQRQIADLEKTRKNFLEMAQSIKS